MLTGCSSTIAMTNSREVRNAVERVLGSDGTVHVEMKSTPFSGWSCTFEIQLTTRLSPEEFRDVAQAGAEAARDTTLDSCSSMTIRSSGTRHDTTRFVASPPSAALSVTDDVLEGIAGLAYDNRADWVGVTSDSPETVDQEETDVPSVHISPKVSRDLGSAEAIDTALEDSFQYAGELSAQPWTSARGVDIWYSLAPYNNFETQLPMPAEARSTHAALKSLGEHFVGRGESISSEVKVARDSAAVTVTAQTVLTEMTPQQLAAIQEFIDTIESFPLPVTGFVNTSNNGEQSEYALVAHSSP